jgi:hypothetical protein
LHTRGLSTIIAGAIGFTLASHQVHAQSLPTPLWHRTPTGFLGGNASPAMRRDSLGEFAVKPRRGPPSSRADIRPYLFTGLVLGAVAGTVVVTERARRRCADCWFMPALEIPLFVGGGALVGYGAGGLVFAVTRTKAPSPR